MWRRFFNHLHHFLAKRHLVQPRACFLVGLAGPFGREVPGKNTEVWGCNRAYKFYEPHGDLPAILTRLFFFDHVDALREAHPDFTEHLRDLDIPVECKVPVPEIPKSRAYPLQEVMEYFGLIEPGKRHTLAELLTEGEPYFTSSITYMIALAIYEGFDTIVLHRFQLGPRSTEYFEQKACINYWVGRALGEGVKIGRSADSLVTRPHPWEPPLYGYINQASYPMIDAILVGCVNVIYRTVPNCLSWSIDLPRELIGSGVVPLDRYQNNPLVGKDITPAEQSEEH